MKLNFCVDSRVCVILPHLQHRALLEPKPILEQTSDVGHVQTQERTDESVLGHLIAHWANKRESCLLCGIISHLYSAERMEAGFEIAVRTQLQTIEMHTVSQAQGAIISVIVMMHCFAQLTLFSSLLEISDLQHPSLDSICNSRWSGVITHILNVIPFIIRAHLHAHFHNTDNRACGLSAPTSRG